MSKRILVISTSLREKSNSQALGDAFAAGAREAGHQVEQISLRGRSIAFCMGCLACQSAGQCVIQDDAVEIAEKMGRAEVIAFATPIYYYEMCGQMKTMLSSGEAVGRKLDFLVQEMNREANTILSKSNDLELSDKAIALKTEIEKVREQIQNIE